MPEELPAWWTWSIFSTQWYFCSATASKPPSSPMSAKEGFSPARESAVVPGADVLVVVEDDQAVAVRDRDDGALEAAVLPGRGGPLLGQRRVLVDVPAGEALDGGDEVGADALRHEAGRRSWSSGR